MPKMKDYPEFADWTTNEDRTWGENFNTRIWQRVRPD
jgi:hypothetical protein